jgi:hypothetical protein
VRKPSKRAFRGGPVVIEEEKDFLQVPNDPSSFNFNLMGLGGHGVGRCERSKDF